MLISALLGIAIGTIMGLTGAGGGIFAVPALVMVLGIEQSSAGSIALLAVGRVCRILCKRTIHRRREPACPQTQ